MTKQVIIIEGLAVQTHIGVPEEERAVAQTVWLDVRMGCDRPFSEMDDDVTQTVDYARVAEEITALAVAKPRKLIETLAAEVSDMIKATFRAKNVSVTVKKRILPNADWVAVSTEG